MDAWQEVWDKLNRKLSNTCSDGIITEEEMESILDDCQDMRADQLIDYWDRNWSAQADCWRAEE